MRPADEALQAKPDWNSESRLLHSGAFITSRRFGHVRPTRPHKQSRCSSSVEHRPERAEGSGFDPRHRDLSWLVHSGGPPIQSFVILGASPMTTNTNLALPELKRGPAERLLDVVLGSGAHLWHNRPGI